MYPVSVDFLPAIGSGHTAAIYCDAWRSGAPIATGLPVLDGDVTIDSTADVRRQLSLTLKAEPGLWDVLAPVGTELRPRRGVRYPNGVEEVVPLGRFPIDMQQVGYSADGSLHLTAPDYWAAIQRARFLTPKKSTRGMLIRDQISALITEGLPGWSVTQAASSTAVMGAVVWDRDRADAIKSLASSIGAEVFMNPDGVAVIRDLPVTAQPPAVWTIATGSTGLLSDATRTRNRQRSYSVVVVLSETADGSTKIAPVVVRDNDPASPTYYLGSFGIVPYFMASAFFRTIGQMTQAGIAQLLKVTGLESQLTLNAATVNPALDVQDTLAVVLPAEFIGAERPVELHLVESTTVPLTVTDSQPVTTRSTGPSATDTA